MMLHDTHDLIHVQLNEEIKLTAFNLQHFNISFLIVIQNRLKRIFNDISHTNANFWHPDNKDRSFKKSMSIDSSTRNVY